MSRRGTVAGHLIGHAKYLIINELLTFFGGCPSVPCVLSKKYLATTTTLFGTRAPLKLSYNGYGHEIFVETEDEHTGKPTIWYQTDRRGNKFRHVRRGFGTIREQLVE